MSQKNQTTIYKLRPISSAVALAMLSLMETAAAQQATAPVVAQEGLQQVVVSANRRIEKLENVPMAISVLGEAELQRNNVREIADVINLTPALTVTYGSTPANNGINMRGIGTTSIGIGVEADVAVIIDDIPMGMQVRAFQDLTDISRIEILKGPQSTLFGKSAIAGAVNIATKPISGALAGSASTLYTSDGEWRVGGSYGGELSEKFGFRVSGSKTNFPGNVNNLTTGSKVNGSGGDTLMAKFSWHLTDALDIDFSPRYNSSKTTCCALVLTSMTPGGLLSNIAQLPASSLLSGITPSSDNVNIRNDAWTGQESTTKGAGLKFNYAMPNGTNITSITSVDRYNANDSRDQDFVDVDTLLYYPLSTGKPAGVAEGYVQYGTFGVKSQTQEFRIVSSENEKLRYVAGLWYGKNAIDRNFIRGYNGIALSTPVQYFTDTYNINKAVFGQATWDFLPEYSLLAGMRYNQETSGYRFTVGNPPPGSFVQKAHYESLDNKENATTGKLSLQHQFNKNLMFYIMGSTGYKGMAYDLTSGLNDASAKEQPVKSETAKTAEVGLKGNFLNNRLTVNVAVFNSRFKDYQQNSGGYLPGTTTYVTRLNSVGGVQTRGVEMDVSAMLHSDFIVNGNFAYTDATISEFPNAPCYNVAGSPNGGFNAECQLKNPLYGNQNVQNLAGGRMPNAPKLKANLGGQYDIRLQGYSFDGFVNASLRYQSDVLTNLNQDPSLGVPGRSIMDIGFGIKEKSNKYKLSFFIKNLFDKHYANTGFTGVGAWSTKAPNPVLTVTNTTWTPARDAFRYFGVRFDVKF